MWVVLSVNAVRSDTVENLRESVFPACNKDILFRHHKPIYINARIAALHVVSCKCSDFVETVILQKAACLGRRIIYCSGKEKRNAECDGFGPNLLEQDGNPHKAGGPLHRPVHAVLRKLSLKSWRNLICNGHTPVRFVPVLYNEEYRTGQRICRTAVTSCKATGNRVQDYRIVLR